jgi:hypothetical protein
MVYRAAAPGSTANFLEFEEIGIESLGTPGDSQLPAA